MFSIDDDNYKIVKHRSKPSQLEQLVFMEASQNMYGRDIHEIHARIWQILQRIREERYRMGRYATGTQPFYFTKIERNEALFYQKGFSTKRQEDTGKIIKCFSIAPIK